MWKLQQYVELLSKFDLINVGPADSNDMFIVILHSAVFFKFPAHTLNSIPPLHAALTQTM